MPEMLIQLLGLEAPKKAEKKAKKGKGGKRAGGKKGKDIAKAKVWDPGEITDGSIPLDDHTKVSALYDLVQRPPRTLSAGAWPKKAEGRVGPESLKKTDSVCVELS